MAGLLEMGFYKLTFLNEVDFNMYQNVSNTYLPMVDCGF